MEQRTTVQASNAELDERGDHDRPGGSRSPAPIRWPAMLAGILVFALMRVVPGPASLDPKGWTTAAVAALMAIWWLTEAVPIPVTALVPLVLFPVTGLASMPAAAAPYANEIIFLFMGGFFLAAAMERWDVHRRIALAIMHRIGTSPPRLVLGFMVATAFISMWINNTATAAMMLPIALAVGTLLRPDEKESGGGPYHFGIAMMLGIAYASSIGGVATLIGTPPNALFAAAASEILDIQVGFMEWMIVGVPVAWIMIPLAWLLLIRVYPLGTLRGDADAVIQRERSRLGKALGGERFVTGVFALTVAAWVLRAPKNFGSFSLPGISTYLPFVADSTIAMAAAVILFVVPIGRGGKEAALDWASASRIPWGVLLLFGGGLSLADAMTTSGLAAWIGGSVASLSNVPVVVMIGIAATLFIFLTEVTSNTAVAAMAMPVMAGVGVTLGFPPIALMATVAIACSMAFMLPAGTPPNAIVFSSGYLTIAQMARAGFWVNLLSIAVATVAGAYVLPWLFGG